MLARKQVRWLGHLARAPEGRLTVQLLTAQRRELGRGAAGCRRATLLGSHGTDGVYPTLLATPDVGSKARVLRREPGGVACAGTNQAELGKICKLNNNLDSNLATGPD